MQNNKPQIGLERLQFIEMKTYYNQMTPAISVDWIKVLVSNTFLIHHPTSKCNTIVFERVIK